MVIKMNRQTKGIVEISVGYLIWGLLPLYWKMLTHVSSLETLLHRVFWSALICIAYFIIIKKNPITLIKLIIKDHNLLLLLLSSTLLALNWLVYLYAVISNHLLQASMGYFISPLLIVFFGLVFFKEKMSKIQVVALLICITGVIYATVQVGKVPYLSLAIAFTFSLYTICKKIINLGGIEALFMDTILLFPLVLILMVTFALRGTASFLNAGLFTDLLLIGGGIMTFIPLSLYISGTISMPAKSVGFLQFITPIMAFFLGVFIFLEPFKKEDAITFILIISGVVLYLLSLRKMHTSLKAKRDI